MTRATLNFVIDLVTYFVMLAMIATGLLVRYILPRGSGERLSAWNMTRHEWGDVHFWLAVSLGVLLLLHLALHWHWVCNLVLRWFRTPSSAAHARSALRRNLSGGAVLAATVLLVGGFVWAAQRATVESQAAAGAGRQERGGREDKEPQAASPVDVERHERSIEEEPIRGSMTVGEVVQVTGLSPDRMARVLGVQEPLQADEQMGRLARRLGMSISTLRERLEAAAREEH
ncbi:MAG: DUF4405 domain-containing protein [Phycisphaerae bacterium]|nr:DUF4405 domain-containing protein [Phycisphaerae bacterium]NUQ46533.1 DUF4405 domain-containing protein [Phycisphaerae bacterium]